MKKVEPFKGNIHNAMSKPLEPYKGSVNQELRNGVKIPEYKPASLPSMENNNVHDYQMPENYMPPDPFPNAVTGVVAARKWYGMSRKRKEREQATPPSKPQPVPAVPAVTHQSQKFPPRTWDSTSSRGSVSRSFSLFWAASKPEGTTYSTSMTYDLPSTNRQAQQPPARWQWSPNDW